MGKKHKKHKSDKHLYEGEEWATVGGGEPMAARWSFRAFETTLQLPRRAGGRTSGGQAWTREGGAARLSRARPPRWGRRSNPGRPSGAGLRLGEYVEKPLKLVLKVGGNEVTELSTGSSGHDSSLFEDKNDHDKHKERKRKKRKKGEKQIPGEEKGRKRRRVKEDKRKRDRDHVDIEVEKDLQCQAPVRLDLPPEKPLASSLAKQEEGQLYSGGYGSSVAHREARPLETRVGDCRKDPSAFFSFPVTDFIAPGYSMIIKHPMDFSTMKEKIKNNDYQSIEELKDNFKLMCTNAMIYNKPETIYYKAAKKLLHSGMKILSQVKEILLLYLSYGPYSSYAPHYDSTFANISKDDSDLIYSAYGEDPDLPGDFSIHEFLATCQDYPYVMADSLLDVLTKGGHSRTLQESETVTEVELTGRLDSSNQDKLTALKAVTHFGAPVEVFDSEEAEVFQRKLDETTKLLRELQEAQNERLSTRPPPNMICLLGGRSRPAVAVAVAVA
ncbi:BRD7, partial [Cervus elaphus hippelaphus]